MRAHVCAAAPNDLLAIADSFYPIFLFSQVKETTRSTNWDGHCHVFRDPWSNSRPVTVSGKNLQFGPSWRQRSAEAMNRKNGPSMVHPRPTGRNHMEDSHCPTLREIDRN